MIVSRSDLRKLRNKVYVRIFSNQTIEKYLMRYKILTQEFIQKFETQLTPEEVCSLRRRVQTTVEAASKASMASTFGSTTCARGEGIFTTTTSSVSSKAPLAVAESNGISHTTNCREVTSGQDSEDKAMDRFSESMSIIMTFANSSVNHKMITSFIGETQLIMRGCIGETCIPRALGSESKDITRETKMFSSKAISSESVNKSIPTPSEVKAKKGILDSVSSPVSKPEEGGLPLDQAEPALEPGIGVGGVQKKVKLGSQTSYCWNVTPWRRQGIIYTKLF